MSDKKNTEEKSAEIAVIDERTIRDKIYEVRGVKVMLDFELAEIYGYETKNFNRQVKNNAERFEGDEFMFRLTKEEYGEILRCKNFTSSWGGSRYLPFAFTEQGLYLLMTVLRGDLAVKQSRALVMAFKAMKDYIADTRGLVTQRDLLRLSMQTTENTEAIPVTFIITGGIMHDRFIVLDYGEKNERIFHCGASSKDAAVKLTTAISEMMSEDMKKHMHELIDKMKKNPPLVLK